LAQIFIELLCYAAGDGFHIDTWLLYYDITIYFVGLYGLYKYSIVIILFIIFSLSYYGACSYKKNVPFAIGEFGESLIKYAL